MICPICNTETNPSFHKPLMTVNRYNPRIKVLSGIRYNICPNCKCCFTLDEIVPETNNQGSEVRNNEHINKVRLERILKQSNIHEDFSILDFGCGNGDFVEQVDQLGYFIIGVDEHTVNKITDYKNTYFDVINCVEVIEHLINPKLIIEEFHRVLRVGCIVYVESSFTDSLGELSQSGYVDPNIGHVLVHSKKSIEMLFDKFDACWINQNVVVFKKK